MPVWIQAISSFESLSTGNILYISSREALKRVYGLYPNRPNVTSKLIIIYFFFLCSRVYGSVNIGIILPHEELLSHLMKYEVLRSVCYTSPSWSRQSHFVIYSRMCATDLPFFANVIWVPWYDMDTNADSIMTL